MSGGEMVVAGRHVFDPGSERGGPPVTHSYAALSFVTEGHSRVEQDGAWTLGPGDVFLVPAGAPHRLIETRGMRSWGVAFCVPCLAVDGAASLLEPFERVRDGGSAVVSISPHRHDFFEGLFRELADVGRRPHAPAARRAVESSLIALLLAEVWSAAGAREVPETGGSRVVNEALRFIERNCLGKLSVADVADAVDRSPTHLTTALTRATGRSAGKWIIAGRMAEARRLLTHSDERVEDIGDRVGYRDATHFIRMFRREHGATPAAWRASRFTRLARG